MEVENKQSVTFKEAVTQVRKAEEAQRKAFEEKRKKQRNGLIRSGQYYNETEIPSECKKIIEDNFWDLLL